MKKVEVLPKEKIPYYQYEGSELVHKIKICKYDVVNLIKFFENVSDPELIDACVYEINSLQAHYSFLLNKAKQEELQSFRYLREASR